MIFKRLVLITVVHVTPNYSSKLIDKLRSELKYKDESGRPSFWNSIEGAVSFQEIANDEVILPDNSNIIKTELREPEGKPDKIRCSSVKFNLI